MFEFSFLHIGYNRTCREKTVSQGMLATPSSHAKHYETISSCVILIALSIIRVGLDFTTDSCLAIA